MIRYNGMHHPQVWQIEVEEDLFLTSFIQPYQSTRMMMPLRENCHHHRNIPDQTQWTEEKWDLTSRMILPLGMHYHPVWLIEVEEDLFFSSLIQQYQSRRMMARHLSNFFYYVHSNHRNNHFQSQWIEEKGDLTLQMMLPLGMHYHPIEPIEVEVVLFFTSFFQYYHSRRMCPRNKNNSYQSQQFQALPTLSI